MVLVGLTPDHLSYFQKQYSVLAPNYFFNPLFKLGRWDGKIQYFQKTGKTYLYLIEEIMPAVSRLGYEITVEDLRSVAPVPALISEDVFGHIMHKDSDVPIKLRDYQVNGVNSLIPNGNGIIVAATGSGKTLFSAALVNAYGLIGVKTLTIVPTQDLIVNTKSDYINCGLDVGEYSGTLKDLAHQHVVSTWQALQHNPAVVEQFQLVLVDEVHLAKGQVLQKLLTQHGARITYRFGLTGTLPKEPADLMSVKVALGPTRATVTASELMERGLLAKLHIDVIQLQEDYKKQYDEFCNSSELIGKPPSYVQYKDQIFPDFVSEKAWLRKNEKRIEWIADYLVCKQDLKQGNILCLVDSIPFGRSLAEVIPGAIFINGQDIKKSADRVKIYDMFKEQDNLLVIATVHIVGTGINIPRIFNLVMLDIGKSFIRVIQGIGRGLRIAHDKDSVSVIDIHSDLKYSRKHVKSRIDYYDEAKYSYTKHKIDYTKQIKTLETFD
jgi:superfamily II DNA or RNA helicase